MSRHYRIRGMDCAEEVAVLKRELGPLVGGEDRLSFDILKARMTVSGDVSDEQILKAVARTGLGAQVWKEAAEPDGAWQRW